MELFGMEAGNTKIKFGKAATAIWIMGLNPKMRQRYADAMARQFMEMSDPELGAVKFYVQNGTWMNCPSTKGR